MQQPSLPHVRKPRRLIAGRRVAGTAVYNIDLERLGTIDDVMIDKLSGRIAYAVLGFGGFMGIGHRFHPLPWQALRFDTTLGGYVVDLDPAMLQGAPAIDEDADWDDDAFDQRLRDHYKSEPVPPMMP